MTERINIGRVAYGGIFFGLFGNPVREKTVSEQYRTYLKRIMVMYPKETEWLRDKIRNGAELYCPGCGVGSPTCHARIIEQELVRANIS